MGPNNIIACCSTLPSRIRTGALERSVRSMLTQPHIDEIYVFYPPFAKRLGIPYPDPPTALLKMPRVRIVRAEDHGPLTKAYPATDISTLNRTSGIILFDDDRVYPPNWTTKLVTEFERRGRRVAVGYNGAIPINRVSPMLGTWNITKHPYRVSVMQTTFLVLYPRAAFPRNSRACVASLASLPGAAFTNDDFVLGVWAHKNKIPLVVLPVTPAEKEDFVQVNLEDDLAQTNAVAKMRMMLHTDDSLAESAGQQRKQLRLAFAYVFTNKLPCPWLLVLLVVLLLVGVTLAIVLPVVLVKPKPRVA